MSELLSNLECAEIHFCLICRKFEQCKEADCNFSKLDSVHFDCQYWSEKYK